MSIPRFGSASRPLHGGLWKRVHVNALDGSFELRHLGMGSGGLLRPFLPWEGAGVMCRRVENRERG